MTPFTSLPMRFPSESFAKAFDRVRPNIVILNASSSPKLNEVFTKLDFLTSTNPNLKISMFGHTVGYLCNTIGKLKNFSGFTVCANPHITGVNCTDSEKEEIKRLLEEGVIL